MSQQDFSEQIAAFRSSIDQLHHKYWQKSLGCQESIDHIFEELTGMIQDLQLATAAPPSEQAGEARQREDRLRQEILESITDGLVAIDREWRITYINDRAAQNGLVRPEELLGKNLWQAFPQMVGTSWETHFRQAMQSGEPNHFELPGIIQDKWYSINIYPSPTGIIVYWQDNASHKQIETELHRLLAENRHQSALLDAIFEADPSGLAVLVGADLRFALVNPAYRFLIPDPFQDPVGLPYDQVWPQRSKYSNRDHFREVLRTGHPYQKMGVEHTFPDGSMRSFTVQARRIEWETEPAILLAMWDTTEINRTEKSLRASEERERARAADLEALMDVVPAIIWVSHDPQCREMTGNRFSYEFLKMWQGANVSKTAPNAALQQQPYRNFKDGREIPSEELPMQIAASTGIPAQDYELDVVSNDGDARTILGNVQPLFDGNGKPAGAVGAFMDITERKHTEVALLESEERFRILADSNPLIIWMSNAQGETEFVNRAYRDFFGVTQEEARGNRWQPLVHPEDTQTYVETYLRAVKERKPFSAEARVRRADGAWRWIASYAEPRFSADGEFLGHVGNSPDITESKQTGEQMAFQAGLLAKVHDAVVACDEKWRISYWNHVAEEIFGQSEAEVIGRDLGEFLQQKIPDSTRENAEKLLMKTGHHEEEVLYRRKDGTDIHIHTNSAILTGSEGEFKGFVSSIRDITQSKQAEALMKRFRLLFDFARDITLIVRQSDGRILEANQAAELAYGYPREEILQLTLADLQAADTRSEFDPELANASSGGALFEAKHRRKDGTFFWVEVSSMGADFEGEQINLSIIRNIDERKLIEEKLKQSAQRLTWALQAGHGGAWEWDLRTGQAWWSPEMYDLMGVQPDLPLDSNTSIALVDERDREQVVRAVTEAVANGTDGQFEFRIHHASRGERCIEDFSHLILDEIGQPVRMHGMAFDITERKQAEIALRETEERFRSVLENSLDVVYRRDLQRDRYDYMSPMVEQVLGLTVEEMNVLSSPEALERVHPDDRMSVQADIAKATETGKGKLVYRFRTPNEEYRWVADYITILKNSEGIPIYLTGILRDITEIKQSETLLLRDQRILAQAELMAHLGAWEIPIYNYEDLNANPLYWSDEVYRIFGYQPGEVEVTNDLFFSHIPPEDQRMVAEAFASALQGHKPYTVEHKIRRKNGEERTVLEHSEAFYEEEGRLERVIGSVQDITDRKRMEVALRESEARFHVALTNAPITVFNMDRDLRYTWIYHPIPGLLNEKALGKRDDELEILENAAELVALKQNVLSTGQGFQQEFRGKAHSGWVYFLLTFEPLRDSTGQVIGLTGSAMDITALRQLETNQIEYQTRLEVQRRLLEQREQERLQIARDLHDGPLQDLAGTMYEVQAIMVDTPEGKRHEQLARIYSSLREQISELRTFTSELRPPTLSRFGLGKAIRSYLEDFQDKHPELQVEFEEGQKSELIPQNIRLALYRIYQESLTNIAKHAHATQIRIRLEKTPNHVILVIQDNGKGFEIPKDWLQLARHKHLGLVGMRERADALGGQVEISSQKGEGTRVVVRIPLVSASNLLQPGH